MKKLTFTFFVAVVLCTACKQPPPENKPSDLDVIVEDMINNLPLSVAKANIILQNKLPSPSISEEDDEKNPYYLRITKYTERYDFNARDVLLHKVKTEERSDGGFWLVIAPSKHQCYLSKYLLNKYFNNKQGYVYGENISYQVYFKEHEMAVGIQTKTNRPHCIDVVAFMNDIYFTKNTFH